MKGAGAAHGVPRGVFDLGDGRSLVTDLDLLAEKVRALGGDPYAIPPTPDGNIPQLHGHRGGEDDCHGEDERDVVIVNIFPRGKAHKK